MPFIVWNDRLGVGIKEVDEDHRELVAMLNGLYDGIVAGLGREELKDLLDSLIEYTRVHFAREEELFVRFDYPDALRHTFQHESMAEWCADTRKALKEGTLTAPSLKVLDYLKDWLFDHIMDSDRRFGEWTLQFKLR